MTPSWPHDMMLGSRGGHGAVLTASPGPRGVASLTDPAHPLWCDGDRALLGVASPHPPLHLAVPPALFLGACAIIILSCLSTFIHARKAPVGYCPHLTDGDTERGLRSPRPHASSGGRTGGKPWPCPPPAVAPLSAGAPAGQGKSPLMHGTGGKQREEGLGPSSQVHRAQAEELPARQPWRRRRPASPWALHVHVRLQKPRRPRRLPGHGRHGDTGPALGGSSPEPHTGVGGQLEPTPIHGSFVGSSMSPSREVSSHFPRSRRLRCQAEPWACSTV